MLGAEVDRLVRDLESEVCPFYLDLQPEIPNLQVRCAWAAQDHLAVCAVCFLKVGAHCLCLQGHICTLRLRKGYL
jgi:hypothetical protein